jgi:hypothetical protein
MREVGHHHYDQWLELGSSGRLKVEEDKAKELRTRKQEQGCMNLPVRFPPHLSTHTTYEKNVVCDAWCPHSPFNLPRH